NNGYAGYGGVATHTAPNLPGNGTYYALDSSRHNDTGSNSFAAASTTSLAGTATPVTSGQAIVNAPIDGRLGVYTIAGVAGGSIVLSAGDANNHGGGSSFGEIQTRVPLFPPAALPPYTTLFRSNNGYAGYGGVATLTAPNLPGNCTY